jgi:DNA-binding response OmpR family regulator
VLAPRRLGLRTDRAEAAELGDDAFVAKPFDVDDLLVLLHAVEQAS